MNFTNWPVTPLEAAEKIECLRYLEHGIPLKMVVTEYMGIEIDTPEDLKKGLADAIRNRLGHEFHCKKSKYAPAE